MLLAYALLGAASAGALFVLRGEAMFEHPAPFFALASPVRESASALGGVSLAMLVVWSTRSLVERTRWAGALARELSPFASALSGRDILLLAIFSSAGEELLFRGLLSTWLGWGGIVASSVVFGIVHQVRGPARWGWVTWAMALGFALAGLFAATGSLAGPLLAHALINGVNLGFLRDRALVAQ